MGNRIDFAELKARVSIEGVLSRYGTRLRKSGKSLRGACPIECGEQGGKSCFDVDPVKGGGVWKCFHRGCDASRQGGDVLDLVKIMEGCTLRQAGVKLDEWFGVGEPADNGAGASEQEQTPEPEAAVCGIGRQVPEAVINPPLGFEFKRVDLGKARAYAESRGFGEEVVERFGLTVPLGGRFAGRVAIPIHDKEGTLVAYAARSVEGADPKYLFPPSEQGFRKSHLLFNLHRVLARPRRVRSVVVVEGFFGCMRVEEAGFPVVALMGSSIADEQAALLRTYFRNVALLLDGDEAGQRGTEEGLLKLGRQGYVRAVSLGAEEAPDEMSRTEIRKRLRF